MSATQIVKTKTVVRTVRRRKIKRAAVSWGYITCPCCHGTGKIRRR